LLSYILQFADHQTEKRVPTSITTAPNLK